MSNTNEMPMQHLIAIVDSMLGNQGFPADCCKYGSLMSCEKCCRNAADQVIKKLSVFDQIKWERDLAIQQLEELGYGLGERVREDDSNRH